jgi:hypothetical protein
MFDNDMSGFECSCREICERCLDQMMSEGAEDAGC